MSRTLVFLLLLSTHLIAATQKEVFDLYAKLDQLKVTTASLKKDDRAKLFRSARFNKIAALEAVSKYDPTGEIGFCFGRAMTVNLIAKKMGLDSNSIKKLFVLGDLRQSENPEWRFHVTTLVKGEDEKWYAVDPIMEWPLAPGGPILMEEWMAIVQKTWDKGKRAHFYLVDASTVIPDLREIPEPEKEEGKYLIELKFDPTRHAGFTQKKIRDFVYSEVSASAQETYFTKIYATKDEDRFQFLDIRINGKFYDFRHYFEDLLQDLSLNEKEPKHPLSLRVREWASPQDSKNLLSPRVDSWFK